MHKQTADFLISKHPFIHFAYSIAQHFNILIVMHIHDEVVIEADRRKEINNNCPETVDVTLKAPVAPKASAASNAGKALSNVAAAGSSALSGAKEKIGNFTQNNENAQKAKAAAVNAGKKIDAGVSNAVANIKNSETYNKVMENEKVQKVMSNEKVQKVSGFWSKLDKKVKYAIGIVAALLIISVPLMLLFGGNTLELESDGMMDSMKCPHECEVDWVGYYHTEDSGYPVLYFRADDPVAVYRITSEDGNETETHSSAGEIMDNDYNAKIYSDDKDGDGFAEFTIYEYDGFEYEEVLTILGEMAE